jgi:hypothetical protein
MEELGESNQEVVASVPGHAEGSCVCCLMQNCVDDDVSQAYK